VLFSGFRNGVISAIDLRQPVPKESGILHEAVVTKKNNNGTKFKGAFPPAMRNQQRTPQSSSTHGIVGFFQSHLSCRNFYFCLVS
jgi:hypothetical protein